MNRRLRNLHRSMGALIALFVLVLATTGLMLNHTSDLKLDQRYITWPWLLEHYGIGDVEVESSYLLNNAIVAQVGEQILLDAKPVTTSYRPLVGGIRLDDVIILASEDALLLLTIDGAFIEKMTASVGIPSQIQNIGQFHGQPVLQTRQGMWRSNFMLEKWEKISLQGVSWSEEYQIPDSDKKALAQHFYGEGITIERLVLDLHNGRILNEVGVWLLDALAILLIILSLSGLWLWLKSRY